MSSTLVWGKHVICKITGTDSAVVIPGGAVYQRDGEIIEVGKYEDLVGRHPGEEMIGSSNHVVMPGLVNDHFHVGLTPFQLGAPDLPLELWSLARMGARRVDPYLDQLWGAIQMMESGTTTVQAIYGRGWGFRGINLEISERVLKAYLDSGMRVSYAPSAVDQNATVAGPRGGEAEFASQMPAGLAARYVSAISSDYAPVEELMSSLDVICSKYGNDQYQRVRVTMAPSNVHRCSDALLMAWREMTTKQNSAIHIHLQETAYQKLYGIRAWNKTPLQHLNDLGFLGPDVVCGHSAWVTEEDILIMAETGTSVCHNASSNLRLQSGIAPIGRLLEAGVRIAIGTDEAGLNDDKDMFQEMRLVLKLHRVPGIDRAPLTAHQVFQMATENGAHASWFGDKVGTLEPGKRADIVLLNLRNIEEPYLDPEVSIVDAVVHRGRGIDVDTVLVDGEVVMRERRLTMVDKDDLLKELKEALDRPLRPEEIQRRQLAKEVEPHLRGFYEGTLPTEMTPHAAYNART